jgi:hypothetical protein
MSDPSQGRLHEQLLEIDRRLRAIQLTLAPDREVAPALQLPARGRAGPLSEMLERSRAERRASAESSRCDSSAELHALAELGRSFVRLEHAMGQLLEDYREALQQALQPPPP